MRHFPLLSIILAFWLSGFLAFAHAQPQQSANFRIAKSVLDAGGAACASANFRLVSAFGQPSPLGMQTSSNFRLSAGFLSPLFLVSPLSPIQALVIQPVLPDVVLYWPHVSGAASYKIYRADSASFTPGPTNLLATVTDTSYTDAGVGGRPVGRNYYIVTALNSGGTLLTVRNPPPETARKQAAVKATPSELERRK